MENISQRNACDYEHCIYDPGPHGIGIEDPAQRIVALELSAALPIQARIEIPAALISATTTAATSCS